LAGVFGRFVGDTEGHDGRIHACRQTSYSKYRRSLVRVHYRPPLPDKV
jgi:hypothetical protein